MNSNKYVIVYDISSTKERTQLVKLLGDFGMRVQLSVFECRLSRTNYERLCKGINKLDIKTGYIKIYKVDISQSFSIGKAPFEEPDKNFVYYI